MVPMAAVLISEGKSSARREPKTAVRPLPKPVCEWMGVRDRIGREDVRA
jgi:hypothetical protein